MYALHTAFLCEYMAQGESPRHCPGHRAGADDDSTPQCSARPVAAKQLLFV